MIRRATGALLILAAFIEAVDEYADLLRASAACAGNDQRLGGCEAPPAIISVFLGESLTRALFSMAQGVAPPARSGGTSTPVSARCLIWSRMIPTAGLRRLPSRGINLVFVCSVRPSRSH